MPNRTPLLAIAATVLLSAFCLNLQASPQEDPEDQVRQDEGPTQESEATGGAVVPPEGPGDTWGYDAGDEESSDDSTEDSRPEIQRAEIVKARLVGELGHRYVREVRRLLPNVGRVEWSRQEDWIAYDRSTGGDIRGLYVSRFDGTMESCLTCEKWDFRKSNVLSPTWHPSGKFLVALVQGPATKLGLSTRGLATPARGLHSDLWVFMRDGRDAWQITQVVAQGGAILDAKFSQEGDRLVWTERVDSTKASGTWGAWKVRMADFKIKRGVPRLGKVRSYEVPWPSMVMVNAFADDDRSLWLSLSSSSRDDLRGRRTARLDLDTGETELWDAVGRFDDLATGVPRAERVVFVTDRGLALIAGSPLKRRTDLWFMSASGRRQERLTYFNTPSSAGADAVDGADSSSHGLGEAWITDLSFSPRGERMVLQVLSVAETGTLREDTYLVTLDPAIAR